MLNENTLEKLTEMMETMANRVIKGIWVLQQICFAGHHLHHGFVHQGGHELSHKLTKIV